MTGFKRFYSTIARFDMTNIVPYSLTLVYRRVSKGRKNEKKERGEKRETREELKLWIRKE